MKRFLIPVLFIIMSLSVASSFAASVIDKISSIDPVNQTVTLNDGQVYVFPCDYDLSDLMVGEEVEFIFDNTDAEREATAVGSLM